MSGKLYFSDPEMLYATLNAKFPSDPVVLALTTKMIIAHVGVSRKSGAFQFGVNTLNKFCLSFSDLRTTASRAYTGGLTNRLSAAKPARTPTFKAAYSSVTAKAAPWLNLGPTRRNLNTSNRCQSQNSVTIPSAA